MLRSKNNSSKRWEDKPKRQDGRRWQLTFEQNKASNPAKKMQTVCERPSFTKKMIQPQNDQLTHYDLRLNLQFQKVMLTIKELQALYELLLKKEETLEQIQEVFLSKFKDNEAVFRASYALSNLLIFNLLNPQQRIIAIFLLIENYATKEGIHKHPFGSTIFQIIDNSIQPFEQKMIYDLVLDHKRHQYAKSQIQTLFQKQQAMIDKIQERPQFKALREDFIHKLPALSQSSKSQVTRIITDFNQKDKEFQPPEVPINLSTIKQSQINNQTFNIGFLRPIPQFLKVQPEEFHWLTPLKTPDIEWDQTGQIQKKIAKVKQLMKKAQDQHLTKDQCTEVERALESQPQIALHLGITLENIPYLIKQNPFLAVTFLVKIHNYPIIDDFLQVIKDGQVSMNSIDVISRVTKMIKISSSFVVHYTQTIIQKVMQGGQKNIDRPKLARVIITFIKNLKKKQMINLEEIQGKLQEFLNEFIEVEEVQQFRKLLV